MTSKILINEDRLIDLIDHIRQDLPAEFRHAQEVCAQREAILAEARREAEAIMVSGERERMRMVSETDIYRQAQMEAERVFHETQLQISDQQASADQYADEVLAELEGKIHRALQTIQNGRHHLSGAR